MFATAAGLLGAGLSTIQAIQAQKQMKQAAQAASQAAQQLRNIKEFNAFKQVQTPTLGFELAQQGLQQQGAAAISALGGAGAEGVIGGVGNVVQALGAQGLETAAKQSEMQYQRDAAQAEAQQGIEERKAKRDYALGATELEGAQQARTDAMEKRNEAIEGIFGSLGSAALGAFESSNLYKKNKTGKGGGINWDFLSGNQSIDGGISNSQPNQYIVGSTINNKTADALTGNKSGQVILR